MILSIPLSTYNRQFLFLLPAVKNNIMERGIFIRIIYSTSNASFYGLFMHIKNETVCKLHEIEKDILQAHKTSKTPTYTIEKHSFRNPLKSTIKISGIWENDNHYGLAYKFIE